MASEPTEEGSVRVELSPELEEWLRSRAAELDVSPAAVLVQLLAAYRTAMEAAGDGGLAIDVGEEGLEDLVGPSVEAAVAETVESTLEDEATDELETRLATAVEERLADLVAEQVDSELEAREWAPAEGAAVVDDRLEELRSEFQAKLEDVRDRVIQVKQETDAKAPADHEHEAIEELRADVTQLETTVGDLQSAVEDLGAAVDERDESEELEAVEAELADFEERLTTVAWVVSDLREAYESKTGVGALEQLKREAAAEDVSRAKCESCGEGVEIGLLTEPACPHCGVTVTKVEPSQGFFGSPRLLVASQLESGDEP